MTAMMTMTKLKEAITLLKEYDEHRHSPLCFGSPFGGCEIHKKVLKFLKKVNTSVN